MKVAQLSGLLRANVGKKDAASVRNAERVPCVVYGQGEQTHFSVKRNDIDKIVFSPEVFRVELDVEGKKVDAIIRELQMHPIKGTIQHVDFYQLDKAKPVTLGLPVRLTGNSRGVMNGGRLSQNFRRLNVCGLPGDLPEAIVIDITNLRINQSIRVSTVSIPGVKLLDAANAVVVAVKMSRKAVADSDDDDDDDEEGAEATEATEGAEAEA